jgi:hypothetical protein
MFPAFALFLLISLSYCPLSLADDASKSTPSIGVATMEKDGTIRMRLRSAGPGPAGEGSFSYAKTNPDYNKVLKHIGGLKPGEIKSVPPWPAETKK